MNDQNAEQPSYRSADELLVLVEDEARRIKGLQTAIASAAIGRPEIQTSLASAADRLVVASMEMRHTIDKLEYLEPFGDDASYWTVYRLFTAPQNLGRVWTMDEIWELLLKNYDMRQESLATVEETVIEWQDDIQNDAAEKGINGTFMEFGGGYVFAKIIAANMQRAQPKEPDGNKDQPKKMPAGTIETHASHKVHPAESAIKDLLNTCADGVMKQADIKKALGKMSDSELPHLDIQQHIDQLVQEGLIYKFRRNRVAYLSLAPRADEINTNSQTEQSAGETDIRIDTITAVEILEVLCAPGTHYQRRYTLSQLWRMMNPEISVSEAVPESELDRLKRASRQLHSIGLVVAGGEKMGTGGVNTKSSTRIKRQRSSSQHVFKIGLASQDIKKELQRVIDSGDLAEHILQRHIKER